MDLPEMHIISSDQGPHIEDTVKWTHSSARVTVTTYSALRYRPQTEKLCFINTLCVYFNHMQIHSIDTPEKGWHSQVPDKYFDTPGKWFIDYHFILWELQMVTISVTLIFD